MVAAKGPGVNGVLWLLIGMIVLSLGLWVLGRFVQGGGRLTEVAHLRRLALARVDQPAGRCRLI